jgi:hypothetical protein
MESSHLIFWKKYLGNRGFHLVQKFFPFNVLTANNTFPLKNIQWIYSFEELQPWQKDLFYIFENNKDFKICISTKTPAFCLIYKCYGYHLDISLGGDHWDTWEENNPRFPLRPDPMAAEMFRLIDAMNDKTLLLLCMDIDWAQPLIEHILKN